MGQTHNVPFTTPHYIDQPQQQFDQEQNIETLHTNALCTIVTETDYLYQNTQFATEKSWHSLFYGTIPVIVSCKGTVNLMREHGLDVYDDLFRAEGSEIYIKPASNYFDFSESKTIKIKYINI